MKLALMTSSGRPWWEGRTWEHTPAGAPSTSSSSSTRTVSSRTSASNAPAQSAAQTARASELTSQRASATQRLAAIAGDVSRLSIQIDDLTEVVREVELQRDDAEHVRNRLRAVPVENTQGWGGVRQRRCDGERERSEGLGNAAIRAADRALMDLRRQQSLLADQVSDLEQESRSLNGRLVSMNAELRRLR